MTQPDRAAADRGAADRDPVNRHELRITGMSRSGNHAIIHWITQQLSGRYCFLNCAEPKTNPFETARPLSDGHAYRANYTLSLADERSGRHSAKDYLLYSYEDAFLGMVRSPVFDAHRDRWIGPSRRRTDVLVLRDPFNLFASRRKAAYAHVSARTARRIWKQHAREFAAGPRYLGDDRVLVSYNRWTTDASYRRALTERLALTFTDAGLRDVPRTGAGSSFDGVRYHGRAHEMDVHRRWRHFADDDAYLALLDDPDLLRLSDTVFGRIPGTEALPLA